MLNSSRNIHEGAHRRGEGRGEGCPLCATPDLSYERDGAGEAGQLY